MISQALTTPNIIVYPAYADRPMGFDRPSNKGCAGKQFRKVASAAAAVTLLTNFGHLNWELRQVDLRSRIVEMNKRRLIRRLFNVLAAISAGPSTCVFAATFTVPLSPIAATAPVGEYLSADFDFGTAFSKIDTLMLEFTLPNGYEGNAVTTGNSSYYRNLAFVLHDTAVPVIGDQNSITRTAFSVRALDPVQIGFGGPLLSFNGVTSQSSWPEFVFLGHGRLAFIDEFRSSFHPLPAGIPVSSTTSWLLLDEIAGASLTIVGTPVPEPGLVPIAVVCGASCLKLPMRRRRLGQRRSMVVDSFIHAHLVAPREYSAISHSF
jgi:hypothetical protein